MFTNFVSANVQTVAGHEKGAVKSTSLTSGDVSPSKKRPWKTELENTSSSFKEEPDMKKQKVDVSEGRSPGAHDMRKNASSLSAARIAERAKALKAATMMENLKPRQQQHHQQQQSPLPAAAMPEQIVLPSGEVKLAPTGPRAARETAGETTSLRIASLTY